MEIVNTLKMLKGRRVKHWVMRKIYAKTNELND